MFLPSVNRPEQLEGVESDYLIYYASINPNTGVMWCPDCTQVEKMVTDRFSADNSPTATIVYVGQRPEWRESPFRNEPWGITAVPTVVRSKDNAKLVEHFDEGELEVFTRQVEE